MKVEGYSLEMPRFVTHTVEVYLYDSGYEATIQFEIGGNTKGGSILEHAISNIESWEFQKRHVIKGETEEGLDEKDYLDILYLINEEGDRLAIEEDLNQLIVGTKIVKWEPEKTK